MELEKALEVVLQLLDDELSTPLTGDPRDAQLREAERTILALQGAVLGDDDLARRLQEGISKHDEDEV